MIYSNMWGQATDDDNMLNSFNLTDKNYKELAQEISNIVLDTHSIFFNVQIPEEGSQYDIIMSWNYYNQGLHQRGIKNGDLIIAIVGGGCYGFTCSRTNNTDASYYTEKLHISSDMLEKLFNEIRDKIGGW